MRKRRKISTLSNLPGHRVDAPAAADEAKASLRARMSDLELDPALVEDAGRLHWYALRVAPQQEFVAQKILRRYGLRTFVPVRREWRRESRFKKAKVMKAFALAPRYVFAAFEPRQVLWFNLFALPCIVGVVHVGGRPLRLGSVEMARLMRRLGQGMNAPDVQRYMRTDREFDVNEEVRIAEGPFEGYAARIVEIEDACAKVLVGIFGRETLVDVRLDMLEAA